MRKLFAIFAVSSALLLGAASTGYSQMHIDLHFGPPPVRHEVVVAAPYPGAVWVPGYYGYDARYANYVWVPGAWQRPPRENVVWVEPRYAARGRGYDYFEGHWADAPRSAVHYAAPDHRYAAMNDRRVEEHRYDATHSDGRPIDNHRSGDNHGAGDHRYGGERGR